MGRLGVIGGSNAGTKTSGGRIGVLGGAAPKEEPKSVTQPLTPTPTPLKFSTPSSPADLKADIVNKASKIADKPVVAQRRLDPISSSVSTIQHTLLPTTDIIQNPKTVKLTPIGEGLSNLAMGAVTGLNDPFNEFQKHISDRPTNIPANPKSQPNIPVPKPSLISNLKESAGGPLAAISFAGGAAPTAVKLTQSGAAIGFGGQYLKNLPQTVDAIKKEPDPNKRLSMIVEAIGGTALAGGGLLHLTNTVKEFPTEKTVSGKETSIPNEQARKFFNEPNPNIDKPTSDLLTRALKDNKEQFVSELRAGKDISTKAPDVTVPTVYGKIISAIQGKLSRGENLTPAETTVVQDIAKNPEIYIPKAETIKSELVPVFQGSNGVVTPSTKTYNNILEIKTSQNELLKQLADKGDTKAASLVGSNKPTDFVAADNHIKDVLGGQYDAIKYLNEDRPQVGAEYHDLSAPRGKDFFATKEDTALAYSLQNRSGKYLPSMQSKPEEIPVGSRPAELLSEPTGTSKIGKSIEAKAIEAKLTKGFEGVAGYDKITIKDQAEKAAKLMENMGETRKVVRGEAPLPDGLRGTALITALEEHIQATGDTQLAYELANSPLTSETSAAAQEMRLAAEREPDSLTRKLQEVKQAKEEAYKRKTGKSIDTEIKREVKSIKASTPKVKTSDWQSFVESIEC